MKSVLEAVAAVLVGLLLIVVIAVAGWQFGWWLKAKNVDRGGRLIDRSYNHQIGLRQQVLDGIHDVELHPDMTPGQRVRIVGTTCDAIDQMTEQYLTPTIAAFAATEC